MEYRYLIHTRTSEDNEIKCIRCCRVVDVHQSTMLAGWLMMIELQQELEHAYHFNIDNTI